MEFDKDKARKLFLESNPQYASVSLIKAYTSHQLLNGEIDRRVLANRKHTKKYPEKEKARRVVFISLRNGSLKRLPCEVCGGIKVDAHHTDYSKPLEVMWLCRFHHQEWHREHKLDYLSSLSYIKL